MKNPAGMTFRMSSLITIASIFIFGGMSGGCQAKQPKAQDTKPIATTTSPPSDGQKVVTPLSAAETVPEKLIVYYFHGFQRCPTCFKLENYAKSVVENDFAEAVRKGKIEWKTVNVEVKGNEHFNDDYKLYTKSVVVSTINNGKESSWKNLEQIWQLVHDEGAYREYIRNEIIACLKGKCL
jgi:hypothetical protein